MKTAVAQGVKEGLDKSTMQEMIQRVVQAIREHGGTIDPSVYERLDALEAKTMMHDDEIDAHTERLERHRRRIRWIERLIHWFHGWRVNPNL